MRVLTALKTMVATSVVALAAGVVVPTDCTTKLNFANVKDTTDQSYVYITGPSDSTTPMNGVSNPILANGLVPACDVNKAFYQDTSDLTWSATFTGADGTAVPLKDYYYLQGETNNSTGKDGGLYLYLNTVNSANLNTLYQSVGCSQVTLSLDCLTPDHDAYTTCINFKMRPSQDIALECPF